MFCVILAVFSTPNFWYFFLALSVIQAGDSPAARRLIETSMASLTDVSIEASVLDIAWAGESPHFRFRPFSPLLRSYPC